MAKVLILTNYGRDLVKMRGPLLREFGARGHEVVIAAPPEDPDAQRELGKIGVGLYPLPVDRTGLNPVTDFTYFRRIRRCLAEVRPHKLLSISAKPVVYGGIAARLAGGVDAYSIVSGLGYVFSGSSIKQRALAAPLRMLYRAGLRDNRAVFFQNDDDLAQFVRWGLVRNDGQGVVTNGDGIDLAAFTPSPLPGTSNFLLIGRLLRDKGVVEYVEAAREVRRVHPDARFRLVGWFDHNPNGLGEAEVQRWVEEGTIEFMGFMPDVRPALADCDIYVLPSYREGLPRTVCEALAMGRPVITTDSPGCRQSIDPGRCGLLVPPRDSHALANAMLEMIENPARARQMGEEGRGFAEQMYDERKVNAALVDVMFARSEAARSR